MHLESFRRYNWELNEIKNAQLSQELTLKRAEAALANNSQAKMVVYLSGW